jgi:cysteine synthase A
MKTILEHIGNTPLIKVEEENDSSIFAKMEGFNPGGSIKDRIALNMIRNAEKEGIIKKGDTLIEPTSGNTGIGLAMVGAMLGYKVKVIMPDTTSVEKIKMIKAFGGEVILVENLRYKKFAIEDARAMAKNGAGLYFLNQYENMNNPYTHYKSTAEEILNQLEGEQLDYFVAGMGTGGTITGIGKKLKEKFPTIKIIGVQPARDERIEGLRSIKDGFVPPIMDVDLIELWGTNDGRIINISEPVIYNIVKPNPTKIIKTNALPSQKMECTLIPYDGLDAYFDYEIIYPSGEVRKKRFESHYIPRQGVCLLGN